MDSTTFCTSFQEWRDSYEKQIITSWQHALELKSDQIQPRIKPTTTLEWLELLRERPIGAEERTRLEEMAAIFYTQAPPLNLSTPLAHLLPLDDTSPAWKHWLTHELPQLYRQFDQAITPLRSPLWIRLYEKMVDSLNIKSDLSKRHNVPWRLFHFQFLTPQHTWGCQNLRFPTPTLDSWGFDGPEPPILMPEFEFWIRSMKRHHKQHLYINFQNREKTWIFGREHERCHLIESISKVYPDTLHVITLTKNSHFYHQRGEYRDVVSAEKFKDLFCSCLNHNRVGYWLPPELRTPMWQELRRDLMDRCHEIFFGSTLSLSHMERLVFIELFYIRFILEVLSRSHFNSFNITCKGSIDRAGSSNALMYLYIISARSHLHAPGAQEFKELTSLLLGPALYIRHRMITESRFDRFIAIAKILAEIKSATLWDDLQTAGTSIQSFATT